VAWHLSLVAYSFSFHDNFESFFPVLVRHCYSDTGHLEAYAASTKPFIVLNPTCPRATIPERVFAFSYLQFSVFCACLSSVY